MLLLSQGCCFIQSLLFSYILREDSVKFSRIYFGSLSAIRTTWYSVRTLISQQHQSRRGDLSVRTPINVLEASNGSRLHQFGRNGKSSGHSSEFEKSQCFNASVWTTWLYRPDAIQCLTRIRVSTLRHSYGKTAATVRTMSSIRQERAYQVQPSGRQPSWSG
jgi:hypothetical protein